MKKIFLLFIIVSGFLPAQKKKTSTKQAGWLVDCYIPNGEKCSPEQSKGKTINDFSFHFEEKARTWNVFVEDDKAIVIYKAFTDQPYCVLLLEKKNHSAEKISEIITASKSSSSYNYYFGKHNYGHHWGLKSDVKSYIKKGILDRQFVISTLNNPDDYKDTLYGGNKALCYIYYDEGVRIYFINDIAVGYDEIN